MTLILRDVLNRMIANAEALQRLQRASQDAPLDAERLAHLMELHDEIGARVARMTNDLHAEYIQRHVDQRVTPYQRRSGLGDRRQP
jgi:hypothetical protein